MTQSDVPAGPISGAARAVSEAAEVGKKMLAGTRLLNQLSDKDVEIATTPKDLVWRGDKVSLYHYRPLAERSVRTPVLITYGMVGRWTMTDLQDDRSLVQNLLRLGVDLYVVDWGNPSRADRWLTLDDYICGYLDDCVAEIRRRAGVDKVNLLGVCEGGVFATCYAALEPERVNSLMLTITPVDFHADALDDRPGYGFINIWTRSLSPEDVDRMIDATGNLPGEFMGAVFNLMTPVRNLTKYNIDLLDVVDDEKKLLNWLRMEKWIADRPDHPGEAAKQWLKDMYQQNKLVKSELVLDGRRVELSRITMPVLNVYAKDDHIIPPATSRAIADKVGTKDYEELGLPGGHVGVFVGGKSQKLFAPAVAKFLKEHDKQHDRAAGPTRSDAARSDATRSDVARSGTARSGTARTGAPRSGAPRSDAARSDAARSDAARSDAARGESAPPAEAAPPEASAVSAKKPSSRKPSPKTPSPKTASSKGRAKPGKAAPV